MSARRVAVVSAIAGLFGLLLTIVAGSLWGPSQARQEAVRQMLARHEELRTRLARGDKGALKAALAELRSDASSERWYLAVREYVLVPGDVGNRELSSWLDINIERLGWDSSHERFVLPTPD